MVRFLLSSYSLQRMILADHGKRTVILWQVSGKEQACLVATGLEIMSDNHMGEDTDCTFGGQ